MKYTKEDIAALLTKNDMAVVRGVEAIYARQTADERAAQTTSHSNGMGFTGVDANILSSFAKQIAKWRASDPNSRYAFPLSPKQLVLARRKMFKYSAQLALVANAKTDVEASREAAVVTAIRAKVDAEEAAAEAAAEVVAERAAIQAAEIESANQAEFDEFETSAVEVEDGYLSLA